MGSWFFFLTVILQDEFQGGCARSQAKVPTEMETGSEQFPRGLLNVCFRDHGTIVKLLPFSCNSLWTDALEDFTAELPDCRRALIRAPQLLSSPPTRCFGAKCKKGRLHVILHCGVWKSTCLSQKIPFRSSSRCLYIQAYTRMAACLYLVWISYWFTWCIPKSNGKMLRMKSSLQILGMKENGMNQSGIEQGRFKVREVSIAPFVTKI